MKHIVWEYNISRKIKQKHINLKVSDNTTTIIMCIMFTILGVLFTQNDFYSSDQWYIEASADGVFGNDNRSLFTLCSNYLITGIIYLFSMTGLRLNWYSIILIIMNLISSALICKVILNIESGWHKYFMCVSFLVLITIYVFFFFQFTTIATYTISAGCLWLFYSIERRKSLRSYLFGIMWIILGSAIRIDSIVFPLIFMGLVWLFKLVELFCHQQLYSDKKAKFLCMTILKYFAPFGIALVFVIGIEISAELLMERANPGFVKWNDIRSLVDDYDMPDYSEYTEEYQTLGISRNDFDLLNDLNNYDSDFFTNQMYEKLLKLKNGYSHDDIEDASSFLINVLKRMTGSIFFIIAVTVIIYAFFDRNIWAGLCCTVLVLASWGLHTYFTYIGRLIERIEYSTWIAMLVAMLVALLVLRIEQSNDLKQSGKKSFIVGFFCLVLLFISPNSVETSKWASYSGMSIAQIYEKQILNPKSYIKFLYECITSDQPVEYETHDKMGSNYIMDRKNILFLISFSDWLEPFPLLGEDILRTAPIGAGENWCILGQYMTHLQPMKHLLEKWEINNLLQAVVKNNVRIVFKDTQMYEKSYVINEYLKEHYYEDVNFSVEAIVNRTVIGRYMQNFDRRELLSIPGKVSVTYSKDSPYIGMSQIRLSQIDVNNFSLAQGEAYIEIHNSEGHTYTCTMQNDAGQLVALFYDDIIKDNENYTISFIYSSNNQLYVIDNGNLLK